jgi:3'-phosphoadenosine 5'-phosphosulfate sulfotransferase (PAPS reductase)/FAD synthetase
MERTMSHISLKMEEARVNWVRRHWDLVNKPYFPAEQLVQKALATHKTTCVSWSGGKCSTAVLYMALQYKPDILVLNNDTGVEYPETRKYIKEMTEKWHLNIRINKPITTFWRIVKREGFPQMRALGIDKKKRPSVPYCCKALKEEPVRQAYKRYEVQGDLDGLRVAESRVRTFAIAGFGQYYFTKSYNVWRYHPIALWTQVDLDKYFTDNKIPINPLYLKGFTRTGCMPCTAFKYWAENLSKYQPKMYAYIMKQMGKPTLDQWLKKDVNVEQLLEEESLKHECSTEVEKKKGTLSQFI